MNMFMQSWGKTVNNNPTKFVPTPAPKQVDYKQEPEYLEFLEWKKQKEQGTLETQKEFHARMDVKNKIVLEEVHEEIITKPIEQSDEDRYNTMMDNLRNFYSLNASSEDALTYGIPKKGKDGYIIAHLFGGAYDMWVQDYDPNTREFFGFASFNGIDDMNAEWGYSSLEEYLDINKSTSIGKIERDFFWTPKTLKELQDKPVIVAEQKFIDIDTGEDVTEEMSKATENAQQALEIADATFNKAEQELPEKPVYKKYNTSSRDNEVKIRKSNNILSVNDNDLSGEEKYNLYSGRGKLHDIEFTGNFHDYTQAKQEFELGQFFTPDWLIEDMVKIVRPYKESRVIDITCGMGRVFNYIENEDNCYGIELDGETRSMAKSLFPKAVIYHDNFRWFKSSWFRSMDYSIGNPPFNIPMGGMYDHVLASQTDEEEGGKGIVMSQDLYVDATRYYLTEGGISIFVVPETWLNSTLRHSKINKFIDEHFYFLAEFKVPNNTFKEYQVNFPCKVILLQKKIDGVDFTGEKYTGELIENDLEGIKNFRKSNAGKFFAEHKKWLDDSYIRTKRNQYISEAESKNKIIYAKDKALKAVYEYNRLFETPDLKLFDENYDTYTALIELECSRLRSYGEIYVLEKLEEITKKLRSKIKVRKKIDGIKMSIKKTNYKIILQRSSPALSEYLNQNPMVIEEGEEVKKIFIPNEFEINKLIVDHKEYHLFLTSINWLRNNKVSFKYKGEETEMELDDTLGDVIKFINNKINKFKINSYDTSKLSDFEDYEYWYEQLGEMEFGGKKLLPHQQEDLAGMLMKDYALVSWDTGLGKTLGGIAWSSIKGGKTLVVAPAVNIMDPWGQQLAEYLPNKTTFVVNSARKKQKIEYYNGEDYLVVSLESLPNLSKQLRALHFNNLIVDESDNTKSKSSVRFKELRVLARNIKRKLLMSGTPTRNNVNEIYNQIELLCNNSVNMLCYAKQIIEYNRSRKEYVESRNPSYMQPFPAWGGFKRFTETFSPKKITCFGANETNQDIFQKDSFDKLIKSIRFTREFDIEKPRINSILDIEDTGTYKEYKQVLVLMNEKEKEVYEYILDDFAKEVEQYYRKVHDGATASMLVIMRQIMGLLQGTSHPWTFSKNVDIGDGDTKRVPIFGENEDKTSSKIEKALEIIDQSFKEGRKIMMASPWRETSEMLFDKFISKGYKTFLLTSEMSKHKRASIVSEFRHYDGPAIITGTMGVLKSGLNLPEVSVVIAESYPWNFAQLHQYAARAVRLNSQEKTMIYCLCAEGSFDINVFALMLKKEVVNKFVRTSNDVLVDELAKEFGTGVDIFSSAMQMVRERVEGKMRGTIKWGEESLQSN